MLACKQGSGISLPDTLAHSYTPIVHLDPLLASIKGGLGPSCERVARENELTSRLTLSPSRALVTPTTSASPRRRITRATFPPPLVFHVAPTHLGWDMQRQIYSSVQGPPWGRNADSMYVRCSRMQSTQAYVHSVFPRTASVMRNLISAGPVDEASSREYAPKNLIARTPVQVSLYGRRF
jgi:hypothetical protein